MGSKARAGKPGLDVRGSSDSGSKLRAVAVSGPALIRRWTPTRPRRPLPQAWPLYSLDVSNHQRELTEDFFEYWTSAGFSGLIVQAVVGMDGRSYTAQQLQAALDHHWSISSYVWCSTGDGASAWRFQQRMALLERFVDRLVFLALDVEEAGLAPEDVDADLLRVEQVKRDPPLYTGKWFFDNQHWSEEAYWPEYRLWDSRYDQVANVDTGFVPYGGWTQSWMKQFSDEPLDQNVCRQA
jgi:hypothetical protein